MLSLSTFSASAQMESVYWEEYLSIPVKGSVAEQTFTVKVDEAGDDYLLGVQAEGEAPAIMEVVLDGRKIAVASKSGALVPIRLKVSSQLNLRISGRSGSGIKAQILSWKNQEPLFGLERFKPSSPVKAEVRDIETDEPGDYLLKVEGNPLEIGKSLMGKLEINGVKVIDLKDLSLVGEKVIFKSIRLQAKNKLQIGLDGKGSVGLTILKNPDKKKKETSPGSITFLNLSERTFSSLGQDIVVVVQGAKFWTHLDAVNVLVNDKEIDRSKLSFDGPQRLIIRNALVEGRNEIEVGTLDDEYRILHLYGTFVARKVSRPK